MVYDGQSTVRTEDGAVLFRLASHIDSQGFDRDSGALCVQICLPEQPEPTAAVIFQATNREFRVCPVQRKAFRFKKDKRGVYNYLSNEKMKRLDHASRERLRSLIDNYLQMLDTIRMEKIRPVARPAEDSAFP